MGYELHNEKPQMSLVASTEIIMVRDTQRNNCLARNMVTAGEQN